jgi:hypothetical protein
MAHMTSQQQTVVVQAHNPMQRLTIALQQQVPIAP